MTDFEELTEIEIKNMFLDIFFWVAENRISWLEEAVVRKKIELATNE